jgi:hypothetical protein
VPHPLAASAHSNYISVRRRSGFLHVAVSKAPSLQCRGESKSVIWALQIRPKDISVPKCIDGLSGAVGLCVTIAVIVGCFESPTGTRARLRFCDFRCGVNRIGKLSYEVHSRSRADASWRKARFSSKWAIKKASPDFSQALGKQ